MSTVLKPGAASAPFGNRSTQNPFTSPSQQQQFQRFDDVGGRFDNAATSVAVYPPPQQQQNTLFSQQQLQQPQQQLSQAPVTGLFAPGMQPNMAQQQAAVMGTAQYGHFRRY